MELAGGCYHRQPAYAGGIEAIILAVVMTEQFWAGADEQAGGSNSVDALAR
jgi:hypothetical protein